MPILNYTTNVAVVNSVAEIHKKLVKASASAILSEYENGVISHISFRVKTEHGVISFRLPANIDGVYAALRKEVRGVKREQAERVAWRIVKDWVEAQLAIIEAGMATLPQVFLPYAQTKNGTVYECFERGGMAALTDQRGNSPKRNDMEGGE